MAEARGREISALFQQIFERRQGITSPDTLWGLARRTPEGRRLRVTKDLAKEWMADEGRGKPLPSVHQKHIQVQATGPAPLLRARGH